MAAGVALRSAVPADAHALALIVEEAFGVYVPIMGRRPAPMDADLAHAIATRHVLVAEEAGESGRRPVGYVIFGPVTGDDGAGFIDAVAVARSHQGRGIGRLLIAAAEGAARRAGAHVVRLHTNTAMTANMRLYPRLGYRETGRAEVAGFHRVFFEKSLVRPVRRSVPGLFGRRLVHGHRAGPQYDRFALDLARPFPGAAALFAAPVERLRMEIGFGAGEHLLAHARCEPSTGLLGVEPFETGIRRAAREAAAEELANLRLFMGDARAVLAWLPAGVLERIDILYPDPWPKRRHWKRRFVSHETLDAFARVLAPGGTVRFASDIATYVDWTRAHVTEHPAFRLAADTDEPWEGWPGTRYEGKALREGRTPRYLTLERDGGVRLSGATRAYCVQ